MSKRVRRQFPAGKILEILRKHFVGKEAISSLCKEYDITPTDFYRWQKRLFEDGEQTFERKKKGNSAEKQLSQKVDALEEKVARKDAVLGELMEEHIRLKKNLGEI